ncbi:MAG: peptide-methionine (S)-S-oxide reductase MsrA [Chloroflexi bacterium]|jgi:peptide-methionine (S)-S-oxide reductase|nr:peptide-methionine (S)-S-oxide reductase MsrA [Chloroflexota bacterium]
MNQTAIVAGGCFWGMEANFQNLYGVLKTEVGYTGGHVEDPTYRQVCQETTGHVEAVRLEFDPGKVSYQEIVEAFFQYHDPTLCKDNCLSQSNQYDSVIFTMDDEQNKIARDVIKKLKRSGEYDCRVITSVRPASEFYLAETYHQNYYVKHNISIDTDICC